MRMLLAIALVIGGTLTLNAQADIARKAKGADAKRAAKSQGSAAQPRYSREEVECERAANADPGGIYAGYPCWAREALSPQGGQDRQ